MTGDRERWNRRYQEGGAPEEADPFLARVATMLPAGGAALDLAGGGGRHALWLAARGLSVTLCDVSDEGLALASRRATARDLKLGTVVRDLETEGLPPGPWDLIAWFHYLHRPLFSQLDSGLSPGGMLVLVHPTERNLERNSRPSARFLLGEGELLKLLPETLEVLVLEEAWARDRHEARLVARRK